MNCIKCNVSVDEKPLHRTKPKGQDDPGFMCIACISLVKPELARELKEDEFFNDLEKIFYNK